MTGFMNGSAILDLRPDEMVLQLAGDQAVVAKLPTYLTDPSFNNLFDQNPYHDTSRPVMPTRAMPQRMYVRPTQAPVATTSPVAQMSDADVLLRQLLDRIMKPTRSS